MSRFRGSCYLNDLLMAFVLFFLLSLLGTTSSELAAGLGDIMDDPAASVSSELMDGREEWVEMAGYGEEKLSTVLVTGSLLCQRRFHLHRRHHQPHHLHHHLPQPLSGVLVGVTCNNKGENEESTLAQGVTDEYGHFIIDLPSQYHGVPDLDKTCSIKVLKLPKNLFCRPMAVRRSNKLKLSSIWNGIRTYTTGEIMFQHSTSKNSQAWTKKRSNQQKRTTLKASQA
ncbi:uncharacterized protein LOC131145795 [Malania oleifera]|uniref:uncharacterized protein LOC131145795 n=1 Tax=Malania oleifera TaxID=397392 RepID=UPI0025AE463C|nr:uncharacterized protein LOC131145795 [Malania oleifera]